MSLQKEIWVIDDHQLFSAGMKQLLTSITSHHTIKCFIHPENTSPDKVKKRDNEGMELSLIIIDFYMPGVDTIVWIEKFRSLHPYTPVIVISSSTSLADKKLCIAAGATAYYPKHAPPETALKNITKYIFKEEVNHEASLDLDPARHNLTARQIEILIQIGRGHSNKKIAQILDISPETVKSHLASIYKLISCSNRDQAIEWARDKGLV